MKVFQLFALIALGVNSIKVEPKSVDNLQLHSESRIKSKIEANNQLFNTLKSKLVDAKDAAQKGDKQAASLDADQMGEVVDTVKSRWLSSIDKEEPEIIDEFLRKMKDAVHEVHVTEGFPMGKVAKARDGEDDWLTKIVESNKKMQELIPKDPKEDRIAVADS